MNSSLADYFWSGGTLSARAPSYIERAVDRELVEVLVAGEYAYVLDTRQIGKSSLVIRTREALREQGIRVALIDLTRSGTNLNPGQWYMSLLARVDESLGMSRSCVQAFGVDSDRPPMERFFDVLEKVALTAEPSSLVVVVDEIDVVLSLPFSADEFFAGIRECFVRRSVEPELNRLSFCLVGSASPASLIRNVQITPFNIGVRILPTDFSLAELAPYAAALSLSNRDGDALVKRVHHWTNGHPYLTQLLCGEIARDGSLRTAHEVDRLVDSLFLSPSATEADHLALIARRILESAEGQADRGALLDVLTQTQRKPMKDDPADANMTVLKLAGVVRASGGHLTIRNRLYGTYFGRKWIEENMPDAELTRRRKAVRVAQLRIGGIAAVVALAIGGLALFGFGKAREADARAIAEAKLKVIAKTKEDEANHNLQQFKDEQAQRMRSETGRQLDAYALEIQALQAAWEAHNVSTAYGLLQSLPKASENEFEQRFFKSRLGAWAPRTRSDNVGSERKMVEVLPPDPPDPPTNISDGRLTFEVRGRRLIIRSIHTARQVASFTIPPDAELVDALSAANATYAILVFLDEDYGHGECRYGIYYKDLKRNEPPTQIGGFADTRPAEAVSPIRVRGNLASIGYAQPFVDWSACSRNHSVITLPGLLFDGLSFLDDHTIRLNYFIQSVGDHEWHLDLKSARTTFHTDVDANGTAIPTKEQQLAEASVQDLTSIKDGETVTLRSDHYNLTRTVAIHFPPDAEDPSVEVPFVGRYYSYYRMWWDDHGSIRSQVVVIRMADGVELMKSVIAGDEVTHSASGGLGAQPSCVDGFLVANANSWGFFSTAGKVSRGQNSGRIPTCVAKVPGASELAIGYASGEVGIFSLITGSHLSEWRGHGDSVTAVSFSSSGTRALTSSTDGTARLWEVVSGRTLMVFKSHGRPVSYSAISPDGRFVVTIGEHSDAHVWDAEGKTPDVYD